MHSPVDAEFASLFFENFGAHATVNDERIDADATSVSEIAANLQTPTHTLGKNDIVTHCIDQLPSGSCLVLDPTGAAKVLVLETDIQGVRLLMDGGAVTYPGGGFRQIRPMLIIEVGEDPLPYHGELEVVDIRKTWNEVHGRPPSKRMDRTELEKSAMRDLIKSEDEYSQAVSEARLAWMPQAKDGDEIKVTPARLKEDPVIKDEEIQIKTVNKALTIAYRHLKDSQAGRDISLVGQTMYSLSIMVEVLGMTAEEIVKDGEALATLTQYLKEMVFTTENTKGAIVVPSPEDFPEGDPILELALSIEDTWDKPTLVGLQPPFMYERVEWKRNSSKAN
jgi:hypothetical protein